MPKQPPPQTETFDIDIAISEMETAVSPYPKAAMFELAEQGYASPFEQLIACIISIRTKDEVSLPVSIRLFEVARTAETMAALSVGEIASLIRESSYAENKAAQIQAIAQRVAAEFGGELPCDFDVLVSFNGVGPKCANLTLGVGCGQTKISVDIHVHRITNRWGYVEASTPEKTLAALEEKLPRRHWVDINRLGVPFGKHICTGQAPRCSICPLAAMCEKVGVTNPR